MRDTFKHFLFFLRIMNPSAFITTPIYLLILSSLLLLQTPPAVESFTLSKLCGRHGHACFGGEYIIWKNLILNKEPLANWGKRALPNVSSSKDLSTDWNTNNVETAMSSGSNDNSMNNDVLDELRLVNKIFK